MKKLLDVRHLTVSLSVQGRRLQAVRDVSFSLGKGEAVGLVGESGCGKTVTVQSLTRLSPSLIEQGEVWLDDIDLLRLTPEGLRSVRGRDIGMVFQDPMTALNPTMRIGAQITESILYHKLAGKREADERALELLHLVGIPEPKIRFRQFPHELSGGMRQRALIAIALAAGPRILIADEPTTALDPTIQAQILDLIKNIQRRLKMSLLLITHDIGVVASVCDRVLVMYAGQIVEQGPVEEVLNAPRHPYTQMLLHSMPRLDAPHGQKLDTIEGSPPSLFAPPPGCPFAARCPCAMNICARLKPPFFGASACWLYDARKPCS